MCNRNLHDFILVFTLPHCALDIVATGKHVGHGGKYKLEILANFQFCGPEKAIKIAKYKMTKIKENLNESGKHFPK